MIMMSGTSRQEKNRNTLDQNFKSLIHRASILSWLLRGCIDELKDKTIDEIKQGLDICADGISVKGRETELISETNGPVIMDNVFDVRVAGTDETLSVIIDVEAQNEYNPGYPLGGGRNTTSQDSWRTRRGRSSGSRITGI